MPKIHFNGKTYNDLAEMPATEREAYEQLMSIFKDEDQDGTPDIFQGDVVGNIIEVVKKTSGDPEKAATLEQMSPLMRARLSKGIAKLHALGLLTGHPDLPKEWPFPSPEGKPSWEDTEIRASKPIIQSPSAIQEDSGSRVGVLIALALMLALCVFGVVVYYLAQLQ
jgi:hypothetical protein